MIGVLLINLGTPEAPTEEAVRNYLNVFLSDPYVITLPTFLRNFLVQKIILPKRPKASAHAYQQVWTEQGSPLLVNSLALQQKLSEKLAGKMVVKLGMRYSKPSIETALLELHNHACEKIIVIPLFPQFANATAQSALDVVRDVANRHTITTPLDIIVDFHDRDFYIDSLATQMKNTLSQLDYEFLLLSYHGLPVRQAGSDLYQAQCYRTSTLLIEKMGLPSENTLTTFQSRLGFAKWIQPYTDKSLAALREKGITKLAVASPSFVADCIETLEEINIRLRAQWISLGGKSFDYIPCLNAEMLWVESFAEFLQARMQSVILL